MLVIILAVVSVILAATGPVPSWRIFGPKSSPSETDAIKLKRPVAKESFAKRVVASQFTLPMINITYNIYAIARLMMPVRLVTQRFVYDLALSMSLIVFSLGFVLLVMIADSLQKRIDGLHEFTMVQSGFDHAISKSIESLHATSTSSVAAFQGITECLQAIRDVLKLPVQRPPRRKTH